MKRKADSYYIHKDSRYKIRQAIENLKDREITIETFLTDYLSGYPSLSRTTFYRVMYDRTVSMGTIKAVEYALNKSGELKDGEKLRYIHKSERKAEQENKNCEVNNTINEDNQDLLTTSEPSNSESLVSTVNSNGRNDHDSDDLCATIQKIQKTIEQRIKEKCGKIRILKMREPISTLELYVNIDIDIDTCNQQKKKRLHLDNIFAKELVKIDNENQPHSQRLIVIGSTGSGKTMLLRRLALSCFQENSFLKEKKHFPIYIRLREYTENKEKIQDLDQYIVSEYNIDISDIHLLSKTGQFLILLDGFDSIESDHKKFVHDQINRFIDRFPYNDYIIACKTEDLIFERFEKVELSPLNDQQIRTLVENRIKVNSPDLSEDQKNELLSQIQNDPELLLIAKNPLLLVLICLICAERRIEGVKKQKWKVIYEAISVLLEGWDREQGITSETQTNFSKTDKAKFLSFVAFRLTQLGRDCLDQQTLEEYILEYIQNILSTHPRLNLQKLYNVQDILTSLESENTLFIKRSDWRYEFPNPIFKDFFTMFFIRREFKSLDRFKSQDIFRQHRTRWERFLKVAESAYPIIFDEEVN